MSKRILVISSSLRKKSNSEALAVAFAEGAMQAGHKVEQISLQGKVVGFCRGCLACQKTFHCMINDDANEIVEKMGKADVLVFATPVYYYGMSGQLKTLLDRANPLYPIDYTFREVYVLTTATEDEAGTADGVTTGMEGWIACFPKARIKEVIFCGGVSGAGDIDGNSVLEKALQAGKMV